MECRDCQLQVELYLAGMLSSHDHAEFTEHIGRCQDCQEQVSSHQHINKLIQECDVLVPSIDITKAVMDKIKPKPKLVQPLKQVKKPGTSRQRLTSLLQDLVASAAAAIILFWLSGPMLARAEVPQYSQEVTKMSNSVGVVFQSYLNFYDRAIDKLSGSVNEIENQ